MCWYDLSRLHISIRASHQLLYVVVYIRMCKMTNSVRVLALDRNYSENSFMFQRISHSRNDIKLRRRSYLRQSHRARTITAECHLSRFSKVWLR